MTQFEDSKTSKLYRFGVVYTLAIVIIAAIANYFTWDTVYESSIVNAFILILTIAMWIALYIPVPVFMTKADWKISEFGFVFNKSTVIASIAVSVLMLIRLGWTFRFDLMQYTIIEAFARVGEELFFRGFIFTLALKLLKGKEKSVLWAILISSVLFAVMHTQTFLPSNHLTMIDIFISGLIMVIIRYYTGSILPGIITHLAGNAGVLGMAFGILIYAMVIIVARISHKEIEMKVERCEGDQSDEFQL